MSRRDNSDEPCTCVVCGSTDARLEINPYIEDVCGEIVYECLCIDCYNSMIGDI
jgi:hypothetical protein